MRAASGECSGRSGRLGWMLRWASWRIVRLTWKVPMIDKSDMNHYMEKEMLDKWGKTIDTEGLASTLGLASQSILRSGSINIFSP